jgi:ATP-dependent exoDNAse (exonuclease V) beta subunit
MPLKVYRSSAGSGKTTTLVNEYLEMLMKPEGNFKSILAITFTNKASAEMKERILVVLNTLADCQDENNLNPALRQQVSQICHQYHWQFSDIRSRAAKQLTQILHQYGSFAVSTIDKFTHQIIRSFAFDLRVPSNFVVETDTDLVVKTAVDQLIGRIGEDAFITKLMVEFMLERIEEEKSDRVQDDLVVLGKLMYNEKGLPLLPLLSDLSEEDFFKLRDQMNAAFFCTKNEFSTRAEAILKFAAQAGLNPNDFAYGTKGFYGALLSIAKGDPEGFDKKRFLDAVEKAAFYAKGADKETKEKFAGIESVLQEKISDLHRYWLSEKEQFFSLKIIIRNFYSLALLKEIKKSIDELRYNEGILPIAEFNHLVSNAIAQEPAPFIYERIGNRFNDLCIDEFQDTSVKQWENLMPLAENVLSLDGTVLLVGDAKQSIYRFRGGDAGQLNALPKILNIQNEWMKEREYLFIHHFLPRTLNYNYRSKSEIIDFNNAFFRHLIDDCLPNAGYDFPENSFHKLKLTYSDVEQECGKKVGGGSVRLQIIDKIEGDKKATSAEIFLARIEALKQQIDHFTGLGYRWGDITILTRANKEAGRFAAGLLERGVHVISRESVRVNESHKVILILDALRWFDDAANEPARLNVLNFLSLQYKKHPIEHAYFKAPQAWMQLLKELHLNWAPEDWSYLPLPSLVKRLLNFFRLDSSSDVFLSTFMDAVGNFYQKGKGGLPEFVQWWNDHGNKLNIVIPEGIDAVQIMTVHKSKGLQFKVVIMPMTDWDTGVGKGKKHWLNLNPEKNFGLALGVANHSDDLLNTPFADVYREEEFENLVDQLNLFYVAFTRAEEQLALILYKESGSAMRSWMNSFLEKTTLFQPQDGILFFGNGQTVEQKKESTTENPLMPRQASFETCDLILDYQWAFPIEGEEIQSLELGLLVHALFSKVIIKDDLPVVAQKIIHLNPVWKTKIAEMVSWMQEEPSLDIMWDPAYKVLLEQDILLLNGKSARPDRLMIADNKVRIFDYKTGIKREAHVIQLRDYATVLMQMNFQVETLALIYVEEKEVILLQ